MHRKRQEGFALAMIGMWVLALMVLTALAVDVSRLAMTGTEVQAVADVGATAAVKTATQGGDYAAVAKAATSKNRADAGFFDVDANPTLYTLNSTAGTYNPNNIPPFAPGPAPWNAVQVTATAQQVGFIFGGFMSALANFVSAGNSPISTSTPITRVATAVCAAPLSVPPDLPMSVCPGGNIQLHVFTAGEACDQSQLGIISPLNPLPSTTQDGCWNDLGSNPGSNPSNQDLLKLFPPDCVPSGTTPTPVIVSDNSSTSVNNGDHSNLFSNLISCINNSPYNGTRNFTIPVTDCGSCNNRTATVQGFVTLQIKASDVKTNNSAGATFGSCNVNCAQQPSGKCVQGIYCAKQVCNPSGVGEGIGTGANYFGECIIRLG